MDTNRLNKIVASNVKHLMDATSENLSSMERATGISRSTLRLRLAGNSPWSTPEMAAVAAHFGTTVADLVTATEVAA